jgi:hypothetical protein
MGWDVDIVHQANEYLIDASYWSRLDSELCYDPSFRTILHLVRDLCKAHPPPASLPMKAEHMPYYRGPRIPVEHCPAGTSTDDSEDTIADRIHHHSGRHGAHKFMRSSSAVWFVLFHLLTGTCPCIVQQ